MERMRKRYSALDGWRGIAALLVAAYHFGVDNHLYHLTLVRNAGPLVDFFFVLSGFVIAHTYSRRVRTVHDAGLYIIRRFGRLWPLHVFTLSCLVLLEIVKTVMVAATGLSPGDAPFSGPSSAWAIPAHLLFLQAFGIFGGYTWNGPSWSIGAEFWTYIVFAGVCLGGDRWRTGLAAACAFTGFLVLVEMNHVNLTATYDLGFFRCLLGFFAGVLTYDALPAWRAGLARRLPPSLLEGGIVVIAVLFLTNPSWDRFSPFVSFLPIPIFSAMLLAFAGEEGLASRWLLTRPMQCLGRWSYSIYMVHFLFISVLNGALRVAHGAFGVRASAEGAGGPTFSAPLFFGDALFIGYLAVVLLCASQTWRYIEEPCRLYFNKLARRREMSDAYRPGPTSIPALPPSD